VEQIAASGKEDDEEIDLGLAHRAAGRRRGLRSRPAICRSACRRWARAGKQPDRRTTSHPGREGLDGRHSKRDAERIGQLLGDDFVAILWDGKKYTKADYLDELRSGKYNVESITLDDTQARVLGDTAIVTYYQAEQSQSAGVDSSSGSAWTNVLAKRDGRWQVIAEHGSRFN
jgi:ketosteroid isomerase-like protein